LILLGNILMGLAQVLNSVLGLLMFLVIARVIVSWVNADPNNPIVRVITASTDPLLLPIRRKMRLSFGGLDFSPIILILVIYFLQYAVAASLFDYGNELKRPPVQIAPPSFSQQLDEQ
jgi:YggT family protein